MEEVLLAAQVELPQTEAGVWATSVRAMGGLILTLGTTGCNRKPDALRRATDCLRDNRAQVTVQQPWIVKLVAGTRWSLRRFLVTDNAVNIVSTLSDVDATEVYWRAVDARIAVDPTRPAPLRHGRIVYWWDQPPSPSERALVRRCIGG